MKRILNRRTIGCLALAFVLFLIAFVVWWMEIQPAQEKGVACKLNDCYSVYTSSVEHSIYQEFSTDKSLYALGFVFGIENEQPEGELELILTDASNNKTIAQSTFDMSTVAAGQYAMIKLDSPVIKSDGGGAKLSMSWHLFRITPGMAD